MMDCLNNAGSAYYNNKGFHSVVLLAMCDAKYCFTFLDIGGFGSSNDASILSGALFGEMFENNRTDFNIPRPSLHGNKTLPYVVVGDDILNHGS